MLILNPRLSRITIGRCRSVTIRLAGFIGVLCLQFAGSQHGSTTETLIDLTHPFDEQTIFWPTEAGFRLEKITAGITDRGYFYAANRFNSAEHGGTHVDAPFHFWKMGSTVDKIPLQKLIGPAVCVDVRSQCNSNRDYQVTVTDLEQWESRHRASLRDKIVLIQTGYAQFWPDRQQYLGTTATGRQGVAELRFPGLDPVAAEWLITRREIRSVGIDTASIDHGQSTDFASHVRLAAADIPIFENVALPEEFPPSGFRVSALPMKITGGSGAPCRMVAFLEVE